MKFIISRASGGADQEGKPVDSAEWEVVSVGPEKEGSPTSEGWTINLESIDDLLGFIDDYGRVIINPIYKNAAYYWIDKYPSIMIYDDYVE